MRRLFVLSIALATALFVFSPIASAQEGPDRSANRQLPERFPSPPTASAQEGPDRSANRQLPERVADLRLDAPITMEGLSAPALDQSLVGVTGAHQVIIHLTTDSVAESGATTDRQQVRQKTRVENQQRGFERRLARLDRSAKMLGSTQRVLNAVFAEVDGDKLAAIAADASVERIAPVGTYQLDLSETVPYIGAGAVQATGVDGSGISVAVFDSGIDYTHAALGGSGNPADYAGNDPTIIEPGTFPTAKVVGGFDFVGSAWIGGPMTPPEAPDPDPLDDGPGAGHGTHVADIIGGALGVAPGVDLYAVKVCSSISTSCSGIALIQGMEFAADPNMDGKTKDRVDIINMSLGASYGQPFDDDLSLAVENATALGILTVASAGNSADKPYVVGTPSAAPTALSVAQTAVPSAVLPLMEVTAPAGIAGLYPAVFQPWSVPLDVTGPIGPAPLQYGDGAGGNLNGCAPFAPGSLSGLVVLVDRGACNFTLKISNIGQAGGEAGIIGLVAPGDPFAGGDGGDRPIDIPGFMIRQDIANTLKSGLPATMVAFDPAVGLPEIMSMVGSSSRGPSNFYQQIKPEIGAPGASVSAIAGTGTETGPFGGTSGAAPMVSGSAALLLDGFATNQKSNGRGKAKGLALSPGETKALLMNNAETEIINDVLIGELAPVTRIGGGEVRVDRAMAAPAAAWDADAPQAALSFGMVEVDGTTTLTRTVRVHNYANTRRTYSITPTFRFGDDAASGAVSVSAPSSIVVKPGFGRDTFFDITITIDGSLLPDNSMNSGSQGANGAALTGNEYDGYLVLDDGAHTMRIPWQVLPRKAAHVVPERTTFPPGATATIGLDNQGVGTAQNDAYSLLAVSGTQPAAVPGAQAPMPDLEAVGINTFPVPPGFCSGEASFIWAFAATTYGEQSHLIPVSHQFWLDTDQDGTSDYVVLNRDLTFSSRGDGRQVTFAVNLGTGGATAFFFAEHATNTGNTVNFICGEQVGLTGTDMLATNVDMFVVTQDWYFGGGNDESVTGLTVTPLGEQYLGIPAGDVPGGGSGSMDILDFGPFPGNSPELGVMLFTNGDRGAGVRGGATDDTETLFFLAE